MALAGILSAGSPRAAEVAWNNQLTLDERYDDNITKLSPKHLDDLGPTTGGTGLPCGSGNTDSSGHRFSITTPDDFISIPQLSSTLKATWLAERPTTFDLDLAAYQYARNPVKNFQSYRLSVSQPLHRFKAHATSVQVSYGFLPRFYLRNLRSDRTSEDFAQVGVFILPPPRREATYRSGTAQLQLDQAIVTDRLRFQGTVGIESRNYNRCFDERDSRMPFREAELTWNPRANKRVRLRASYGREVLRAHGNLTDTPDFSEPDITNARNILSGDVRVGWKHHGRGGWVGLRYETERREFKANNPNDISHFGRTDRRKETSLAARVDLKRGWLLSAETRHESNRSNFPVTPGSTFEPDEITNYDDNVIQFGFGYRFRSPSAGKAGRDRRPDSLSGKDEGMAP